MAASLGRVRVRRVRRASPRASSGASAWRRCDGAAWLDAWARAFGNRPGTDEPGTDEMDRHLHAERVKDRRQRRHLAPWRELSDGAFVVLGEVPALVSGDRLVAWSPGGYGHPLERPRRGDATAMTPASTLAVLGHGYRPAIHPSAARTDERSLIGFTRSAHGPREH